MIKSQSPPKNTFSKPEVEENFLNLIKGTYFKNLRLVSCLIEKNCFPANISNEARISASLFIFYIVLDVLASAMKQEKEITSIKVRKEKIKLSLFTDA